MVEKKICRARLRKRRWIDAEHAELRIARQCELVGLPRSTLVLQAGRRDGREPGADAVDRRAVLDRRRFTAAGSCPKLLGVNRKRVQRLMRVMGLEAIYPKRRTTRPGAGHKIYPYLLRNVEVTRPDQVWASDITYVPLRHGFLYLVAVMDWYSRYVLSWRLSNTLEGKLLSRSVGGSAGPR